MGIFWMTRVDLWCKWDRRPSGWYKLNMDGFERHGQIIDGGQVKDEQGRLSAGFSLHYWHVTNIIPKFHALLKGLELCQSSSARNVYIQSDSWFVVMAIQASKVFSWRLEYIIRQCLDFLMMFLDFSCLQTKEYSCGLFSSLHSQKYSLGEVFFERDLSPTVVIKWVFGILEVELAPRCLDFCCYYGFVFCLLSL